MPLIQMNRRRYKKVPRKVTGVHSMPLPSSHSLHWLFDIPQTPECLPQGHCTCCFLCLESSSTCITKWLPLSHSFKSFLKYPSYKAFPIFFFRNSMLNFLSLLYFSAQFLSLNTVQNKVLLFAFFTRCKLFQDREFCLSC